MSTSTATPSFSQNDWNEYARCYDSIFGLAPYVEMLKNVAQNVLLGECSAILDAACGTGNFELLLITEKTYQTPCVIGVDSSRSMLQRAKEKCEQYDGASFFEADLNVTFPFGNETFSQIVSVNTLYAVSSPKNTLAEFSRVLKKGGTLHLVTPIHGYENGLILKAHCRSKLPDDFWANAHATPEREEFLIREAVNDEKLVEDMLTVARHNRSIARTGAFHFFEKGALTNLLAQESFSIVQSSLTYANQALSITATKM